MGVRFEEREDGIWLVFGTDLQDYQRKAITRDFIDGDYEALEDFSFWCDVAKPKSEYKILDLSHIVMLCESYNKIERLSKFPELICVPEKIMDMVNKQREEFRRKIEEEERLAAEKWELHCRECEEKAINESKEKKVFWNDKTKEELHVDLAFGLLPETAETKTLYEMYDDGLI